jgi:type IV secretory pathway VirJ component
MIRRYGRAVLVTLLVLILALAGGYWLWNRPAPAAHVEQIALSDGSKAALVTPGTRIKSRVALAVPAEQMLNDNQLLDLSQSGSAQILQIILPKDDCVLQAQALQTGLKKLDGAPDVVSGIGPGATLAWQWLASQNNDKAQAISVDFTIEHAEEPDEDAPKPAVPPPPFEPKCKTPLAKSAAHGKWTVAWNDNPDDVAAAFVRDQPNAQTSISDYDVNLPQVMKNSLADVLVGQSSGQLKIPVVEVPAGQSSDTVTLFLSGDGGWRDLDRDVAGEMAKLGYPVVGIDTLRYYWQHKSPEETAYDLAQLMHFYRQKWGTKRFILAGYSFGADVLPAIYNRLLPEDQSHIDGVILLAFARTGSFEIAVEGWLGAAGKEAPTGPEMAKLPAAKVLCVYGKEEADETGCTEATAPGTKLELPGGHHFDENYPALAKRLTDAIDKFQGKEDTAQK